MTVGSLWEESVFPHILLLYARIVLKRRRISCIDRGVEAYWLLDRFFRHGGHLLLGASIFQNLDDSIQFTNHDPILIHNSAEIINRQLIFSLEMGSSFH